MKALDDILLNDPDSWLEVLPGDQRAAVEALLTRNAEPLDAAAKWLVTVPSDKRLFGALGRKPLVDRIVNEVRGFLCGDPEYEEERKQVAEKVAPTQLWVVSALTAAIAPKLGVAAELIVPVVVLVFISFGKCTLNAVCKVWNEQAAKTSGSAR